MAALWRAAPPLPSDVRAALWRRAIFECGKWDPQVGDLPALADFPIVLPAAQWRELHTAATALYHETLALEAALLHTPHLHRALALPWCIRRVLAATRHHPAASGLARVMRFDFHFTTAGWRISEVNSDVPGGFIEAGAITALFADHYRPLRPTGDPAKTLVDALAAALAPGADLALVHATAYTDDRQVMAHLAQRCTQRGLRAHLAGPEDLHWIDGRAQLCTGAARHLAAIVRFFPAEWLPNLPRRTAWHHYFVDSRTPQCNPAIALLTQSKRVPLLWDELHLDLPIWRRLLPETRVVPARPDRLGNDWVLKPALGRVGDSVGIPGVTPPQRWRRIVRWARWRPRHWIAQRRFVAVPLVSTAGDVYPCIGIFVIGGKVAGAYGRISSRPLIDDQAQDAAVLLADEDPALQQRRAPAHVAAGTV